MISLAIGPAACGYQDVLLLTVSKRLGQPARTSEEARQYVRDPSNRLATARGFASLAAAPPDAQFTGYRYETMELWASAALGPDAVILKRGTVWELWPRALELVACA